MRAPAESSLSPLRMSEPRAMTFVPASNARSMRTAAAPACASSMGTTASAPSGNVPPVGIRKAVPRATAARVGSPMSTSPAIASVPGVSAATSANPSIADRGAFGKSSAASTSRASTRPNASSSATRSTRGGARRTREKYATSACCGARSFLVSKPAPGRSAFAGCVMARFSMLDIAVVRRDPDRVRRSARRRGLDPSFVDDVLRYDAEYRSALSAAETSKAEKNRISAEIGRASDKAAAARELRPKIETLTAAIAREEERARALSPEHDDSPLRALLEQSPNLLDDTVPDGADENANVTMRVWGEPPTFDFAAKPHWEIG